MIGTSSEVLGKIIERAAELYKVNPSQYSAETRFVEDLKAKSVNYVQIISVLEEEFDIQIPFMEFRRKKTFGEAAEYVAGLHCSSKPLSDWRLREMLLKGRER